MSGTTAFHPGVDAWFASRFEAPTDVQARSWPRIAAGQHLVITAPTGSGKTLTAFLWALNAFATGASLTGATRVLYVSPLKALNNDIQRNLTEPLRELRHTFEDRGETFPNVRAATRSGDTPQGERQRLLRRPPEILITTPESLLLLLTTTRGRQALSTVETVITDEIHSILDNRRGASLMTSLERLVEIAGEFQRIALSATVRPLEAVARFVGGSDEHGRPREVGTVCSATDKQIELAVRFPEAARDAAENGKKVWEPLSDVFRDVIDANRSTLIFANSRRLTEKITLKLNDDAVGPIAYAHHGSLSREVRTEVERRFKDGDLSAIVATNSLEMGIDIGDLDQVVLVQSPPSLAASLQRIGRAGHNVGDTSRAALFPTHARDFLEAAAIANAVSERDIEPLAGHIESTRRARPGPGVDDRIGDAHRRGSVPDDPPRRSVRFAGPPAIRPGRRDARRALCRHPHTRPQAPRRLRPDPRHPESAQERRFRPVQRGRNDPRPGLLPAPARGVGRPHRRARRRVRLGGDHRAELHPRHPELAHRAHHAQRCPGQAGRARRHRAAVLARGEHRAQLLLLPARGRLPGVRERTAGRRRGRRTRGPSARQTRLRSHRGPRSCATTCRASARRRAGTFRTGITCWWSTYARGRGAMRGRTGISRSSCTRHGVAA